MKRIIATLSFVAVSALLLAGCASVSGNSGTNPVDLTKPSTIASLCGADAASVQATIASAADAKPNSGKRLTLSDWGIDPTDDKAVASILTTLDERAAVKDCKTDAKTASDTKVTDAERDAIIKALTVKTVPASAVCKTDSYGNVAYVIDSLLGVPPRLWPDAISTKITATDPTAARIELQEAICKDPLLGTTWLTFVSTTLRDKLMAATGIDLLVLNPRLKEYTDVSQITPKATAFVPLLNVEKPTTEQVDNAVKQNATWQQDAALVNTLLERFAVLGIDARQSLVNYHLADYALDVDSLPTVGINDKQENLPALIFAITEKGQCGEITTFGANTGDKRPELFEAKTCEAPPTTTTPDCNSTGNCPTTTTPGCTESNGCKPTEVCPPGTTGHYPVCKDSSTNDPSQNGNANTGGGKNADPGPGTYVPPTQVQQPPSTPYTPPAAPSGSTTVAPPVTPSGPSTPAPSTDTSGQNTNGSVPGTGSGASCNPVVMSC